MLIIAMQLQLRVWMKKQLCLRACVDIMMCPKPSFQALRVIARDKISAKNKISTWRSYMKIIPPMIRQLRANLRMGIMLLKSLGLGSVSTQKRSLEMPRKRMLRYRTSLIVRIPILPNHVLKLTPYLQASKTDLSPSIDAK